MVEDGMSYSLADSTMQVVHARDTEPERRNNHLLGGVRDDSQGTRSGVDGVRHCCTAVEGHPSRTVQLLD